MCKDMCKDMSLTKYHDMKREIQQSLDEPERMGIGVCYCQIGVAIVI